MNYVNRVQLLGTLVRGGDVRETEFGVIARLAIVTEFRFRETTNSALGRLREYHRVYSVVPQHIEKVRDGWAVKGRVMMIDGRLRTWSYTDKDGTVHRVSAIRAHNLTFFPWREETFKDLPETDRPDGERVPDSAVAAALGYSELRVEDEEMVVQSFTPGES